MTDAQEKRLEALKAALDAAIAEPLTPEEALEVLVDFEGSLEARKDALHDYIRRLAKESQ